MIVASGVQVETNIRNSTEFKISTNSAKLFSMLSSALYSEKELCVMYEIAANAIDSHNMNGRQDTPIMVVLPTQFEPFISITDYGPGMSEDNVFRFLTTYGESSKQDSNDAIGGWGIGSKSPAAVSDTWTITSRYSGMSSDYLVYVNGDGVPTLTKIKSSPCDIDDTGLTVKIPVQAHRFSAWSSIMDRVFAHYKVKPNLINGQLNKYRMAAEPTLVGLDDIFMSESVAATAIICSRAYPLSSTILSQEFTDPVAKLLVNARIQVTFDIGELDLSISREQLQYTKKTISALEAKYVKYGRFIEAQFMNDVGGIDDPIAVRVALANCTSKYLGQGHQIKNSFTNHCIRVGLGSLHTDIVGMDDLNSISFDFNQGTNSIDCREVDVYHLGKFRQLNERTSGRSLNYKISFNTKNRYSVSKMDTLSFNVASIKDMKFVIADCKDAKSRVRNMPVINSSHFIVLVKNPVLFPKFFRDKMVLASSLAKPVRIIKPRVRGSVVTSPVYTLDYTGRKFNKTTTTDLDFKTISAFTIVDSYVNSSAVGVDINAMGVYRGLVSLDVNMIVVKSTDKAVLALIKTHKIPTVKDFLTAQIPVIKKSETFVDSIETLSLQPLANSVYNAQVVGALTGLVDKNSIMGKFLKKYPKRKAFVTQYANPYHTKVEAMLSLHGLSTNTDYATLDLEAKADLELVKTTYPMVSLLQNVGVITPQIVGFIVDYVKLVNK